MKKNIRKKIINKRNYSGVKLAFLALLLLGSLIFLNKLVNFINNLNEPFSADSKLSDNKFYSWDGRSNLNLVIQAKDLYFLNLNYGAEKVTIVKIPAETYLNLPFAFGKWPARSIYNLGQAEIPTFGGQLLKESLSLTFGIPVDGYVLISGNLANSPLDKTILNFRQNPWRFFTFLKQVKTDLSISELFKFWGAMRSVRPHKFQIINLDQTEITNSELLKDGSRILGIDQIKLDQFVQDQCQDSKLINEAYTIGLLNSTETAGLAEKAARLINNLGGRVIFTGNWDEKLKNSMILGKDSYTKLKLGQIFTPTCFKKPIPDFCEGKNNLSEISSRADITIILGSDFAQKFLSRNLNFTSR